MEPREPGAGDQPGTEVILRQIASSLDTELALLAQTQRDARAAIAILTRLADKMEACLRELQERSAHAAREDLLPVRAGQRQED